MKNVKVLIDNGHGLDTLGKRSPDGMLKEFEWTRDVARRLSVLLTARNIPNQLIVPELKDIPLSERVARVNRICAFGGGAGNFLLVSIHVNASGSTDEWRKAHGWSVFVGMNGSANSKLCGNILARKAGERGLFVRRQYPDKGYWQQSLAIVRDTSCPAVLTENLFMDNRDDCRYLMSEDGREAIARLHADGIVEYRRQVA